MALCAAFVTRRTRKSAGRVGFCVCRCARGIFFGRLLFGRGSPAHKPLPSAQQQPRIEEGIDTRKWASETPSHSNNASAVTWKVFGTDDRSVHISYEIFNSVYCTYMIECCTSALRLPPTLFKGACAFMNTPNDVLYFQTFSRVILVTIEYWLRISITTSCITSTIRYLPFIVQYLEFLIWNYDI